MGQYFVRFDDAMVHRIDLQDEYSVNLIFYKWEATNTKTWTVDLESINFFCIPNPLGGLAIGNSTQSQKAKPDLSLQPPLITRHTHDTRS